MNSTVSLPRQEIQPATRSRANSARFFFSGAAALLVLFVFLGFQRFYLHGKPARGDELFAPMRTLLIVHGIMMTGWILLFLAQPLLIATGNRRLHMKLGILGVALAAGILVLGPYTAIMSARLKPDTIRFGGIHSKPFLAIPLGDMLIFGTFVLIGLLNRHRPQIHRPMMLLATMGMMGAATSRIVPLRQLHETTIWAQWFGSYFVILVVGALLLVVKTALTRSFDRWFAGGYAALVVACGCIEAVARSATWEHLVNRLIP